MSGKGQSAIEYFTIVGIGLLIATPFIVLVQEDVISLQTDSADARFSTSLDEMANAVERADALGEPASTSFNLNVPSGVESSTIESNFVVFTQNRSGQASNITRSLNTNITGNLPVDEGSYQGRAEAWNDQVRILFNDPSVFRLDSTDEWLQGSFNGSASWSGNDQLQIGYLSGANQSEINNAVQPGLDSIIGQWRMNEDYGDSSDGDVVKDFSGRVNNGTTVNNVDTSSQGIFSTDSFDFDGSGSYVETDADAGDLGIGGNNSKTVVAWANTRTFDDSGAIFSFGDPGSDGEDFALRVRGSEDEWRAQFWGAADIDFSYPSHNRWVQFAVVHTGDETIIYTDGSFETSSDQTLDTSTAQPFRIGWWSNRGSSETFDGKISDVMIFDTNLSESDIEKLYLQGMDSTFEASYTSKVISRSKDQNWQSLEVSGVEVPSNTEVDVIVEVSDDFDSGVDVSERFTLTDDISKQLDLSHSKEARIRFEGNTTSVGDSWKIDSVDLEYAESFS